jgi:alpha-D-xyloside xylohydrolase
VQYFEGVDFAQAAGSAIDEKVDHNWPGPPLANPPPGLTGFDNFSARWEGTLTAPEAGEYEIGVEYDDGARLFLDGKLLVEDWSFGAKRYRGAKITLAEGQAVALKAEFHQGGQERYFRLGWRKPSERRALAAATPKIDNALATYLPAGPAWFDFWTNERFAGGTTVTKACTLDVLPVYVRAGSIVPMGPAVQYVTEKPDAPYEIRIYPGADATFTVYEDDNETYNYEKGQRATYTLTWNDAAKTLSIGARQGTFPGLVTRRELNVVLISEGQARPAATRKVTYDGTTVQVSLK